MLSHVVFADGLPVFTLQPTNQTVLPGSTATFVAAATGATSYQWLFNGTNISGANGATLQIVNAQTTDTGYYLVIAKNSTGWVPSGMVYLFLDYSGGIIINAGGMLPLANTNYNYFQGQVTCYSGIPTPTNGVVQIVAGPQLDQMQPVGTILRYGSQFYNGYYNAADQSAATIAPGQACYYSVLVKYTNNGVAYKQPSTVKLLNAGTNGTPAPTAYGLKFPAWFAGEGLDPVVTAISPTNQLRVASEGFSITNTYSGYTDYGIPTVQWRKNGVPIFAATNNILIYGGYSGPQLVYGSWRSVLNLTNIQDSDTGVYDLVVYGNEWVISPKIFLGVQTANGQGVFQQPKFLGTIFVCALIGAAGRNYKVQQSTNLFNWSDLVTLSNATGTVTFTNPPAGSGACFYRTVLVP